MKWDGTSTKAFWNLSESVQCWNDKLTCFTSFKWFNKRQLEGHFPTPLQRTHINVMELS